MSASRTAKRAGFTSLKEVAELIGLKPHTLSVKYNTNRDKFMEDLKEAKSLKGGKQ